MPNCMRTFCIKSDLNPKHTDNNCHMSFYIAPENIKASTQNFYVKVLSIGLNLTQSKVAKICHPVLTQQHEYEWTLSSSSVNYKQLKVHELQTPELSVEEITTHLR